MAMIEACLPMPFVSPYRGQQGCEFPTPGRDLRFKRDLPVFVVDRVPCSDLLEHVRQRILNGRKKKPAMNQSK